MSPATIASRALDILKTNASPSSPLADHPSLMLGAFASATLLYHPKSIRDIYLAASIYEPMARLYLTGASQPSCNCDPQLHGCPACDPEPTDAANNHGLRPHPMGRPPRCGLCQYPWFDGHNCLD